MWETVKWLSGKIELEMGVRSVLTFAKRIKQTNINFILFPKYLWINYLINADKLCMEISKNNNEILITHNAAINHQQKKATCFRSILDFIFYLKNMQISSSQPSWRKVTKMCARKRCANVLRRQVDLAEWIDLIIWLIYGLSQVNPAVNIFWFDLLASCEQCFQLNSQSNLHLLVSVF